MRTNADKGEGGLIAYGRPQLSVALRLAVLACSCMTFLVTPTMY